MPVVPVTVAPVSTTGVVTAVPVPTVLSAPVPVSMLLTFCIALRVACVLASTPLKVTPFPASDTTLLLTLANCKPLGVPVVVAVVSVPVEPVVSVASTTVNPVVSVTPVPVVPVPTVLSAPVPVVSAVVEPAVFATVAATSVPVVTAVEFCSWLIMLTASVALNEPAAELTSVLNAAVVLP